MCLRNQVCKIVCQFQDIMFKKIPNTMSHQKAWDCYQQILMYRANLAQISRIIYFAFFAFRNQESIQQSLTDREESNPQDSQLIKDVYHYMNFAIYVIELGRIILIVISIKKLHVTRFYFYYEILQVLIDSLNPRTIDQATSSAFFIQQQMIQFICFYFSWWPSLICCMLSNCIHLAIRSVFLHDQIDSFSIIYLVLSMLWLAFNLLIIHLIFKKAGQIFVEAEILREGNA